MGAIVSSLQHKNRRVYEVVRMSISGQRQVRADLGSFMLGVGRAGLF